MKNFKSKIVRNDKDIFIKILSTIPIWDEQGVTYTPQHLIHIGASSGEQYVPSTIMPCALTRTDFLAVGKQKLTEFINHCFEFSDKDHIFVNYEDRDCLIFSKTGRLLSPEDKKKIITFQQRFMNNECFVEHDRRICLVIRQRTAHCCTICESETSFTEKDALHNKSGPSTEEKDSLPTQNDKGKAKAEDA